MYTPFEQLPSNVMAALQRGNQIEAIKLLREATGLGLKEARDVIDHHGRAAPPTLSAAVASALAGLPNDVIDAWKKGNKIEAIKLLRARGGAGLQEAKQAIEAFERQQKSGASRDVDQKVPGALAEMIAQRQQDARRQLSPGEVPQTSAATWLVVIVVAVVAVAYWMIVRPGA